MLRGGGRKKQGEERKEEDGGKGEQQDQRGMDRFLRGERHMGEGVNRGGAMRKLFFSSLPQLFCPPSLLHLHLPLSSPFFPTPVIIPTSIITVSNQHFPLLILSHCGKMVLNESFVLFTAACVSRGISCNTAVLITLKLPATDHTLSHMKT